MTITVYGIKNCTSVKKALGYLNENKIDYDFYDYKKHAPTQAIWAQFVAVFDFDKLINKQGTTYKKLAKDTQKQLDDAIDNNDTKAVYAIICEHTSLLKRPIVLGDGVALVGFDEERFGALLPSR